MAQSLVAPRKAYLPTSAFAICGEGWNICITIPAKISFRQKCNFPEEITSIVEDERFRATYRLWDNALKTFPKGYETGFHGDYLLKYKALSAYAELSDDEVLADDFEKRLARRIEIAVPMNAFLTRALEAPDEEKIDF